MKRTILAFVVAAVLLTSARAAAETLPTIPTQLLSPTHLETEGGAVLDLPAYWWIIPPLEFTRIDDEMTRLQNAETSLTVEIAALQKTIQNSKTRWYWIAGALSLGFSAGMVYQWAK